MAVRGAVARHAGEAVRKPGLGVHIGAAGYDSRLGNVERNGGGTDVGGAAVICGLDGWENGQYMRSRGIRLLDWSRWQSMYFYPLTTTPAKSARETVSARILLVKNRNVSCRLPQKMGNNKMCLVEVVRRDRVGCSQGELVVSS